MLVFQFPRTAQDIKSSRHLSTIILVLFIRSLTGFPKNLYAVLFGKLNSVPFVIKTNQLTILPFKIRKGQGTNQLVLPFLFVLPISISFYKREC